MSEKRVTLPFGRIVKREILAKFESVRTELNEMISEKTHEEPSYFSIGTFEKEEKVFCFFSPKLSLEVTIKISFSSPS